MVINELSLYAGAIIVAIWGIAHVMPVKSVVKGFNLDSNDNKLIINNGMDCRRTIIGFYWNINHPQYILWRIQRSCFDYDISNNRSYAFAIGSITLIHWCKNVCDSIKDMSSCINFISNSDRYRKLDLKK